MCVCDFLLKRHRLLLFIMFSSVLPFWFVLLQLQMVLLLLKSPSKKNVWVVAIK